MSNFEDKAVLEETSQEAESRRAGGWRGSHTTVDNGGLHREGPVAGCQGCEVLATIELTPFERDRHVSAWASWHRATMVAFVPIGIVELFWALSKGVEHVGDVLAQGYEDKGSV